MLEYYVLSKQTKTFDSEEKKQKFIVKLDEKPILKVDELAQRVAKRCTLSPGEVKLAIDEIENVWFSEMSIGRPVQVGSLGVLRPTINATLQDNEKDADQDTIKRVFHFFRASSKFRNFLKSLKLRKIIKKRNLLNRNLQLEK